MGRTQHSLTQTSVEKWQPSLLELKGISYNTSIFTFSSLLYTPTILFKFNHLKINLLLEININALWKSLREKRTHSILF